MEEAVAAQPDRFVVADVKWTQGTEQMLDAVGAFIDSIITESTCGLKASYKQHAGVW